MKQKIDEFIQMALTITIIVICLLIGFLIHSISYKSGFSNGKDSAYVEARSNDFGDFTENGNFKWIEKKKK